MPKALSWWGEGFGECARKGWPVLGEGEAVCFIRRGVQGFFRVQAVPGIAMSPGQKSGRWAAAFFGLISMVQNASGKTPALPSG